ncbi:MAG: hypothetical protein KAT58_00270, partial [candidate division Zixibacteria bacterium]|nr:hypothetical protein [candidate division Zixibacteria bacterium]
MKRQTIIICFAALLLLLANCSQQSPNSPEGTVVTIRASLKGLGVGSDIVKVILKVSGDDFDTLTHQLQLEQGEATAEIEIPFGSNRHFAMSAFNSDSVVLYQGETTANVIAGVPTEVVIYLEPQVTMLRISPMYSETLLG